MIVTVRLAAIAALLAASLSWGTAAAQVELLGAFQKKAPAAEDKAPGDSGRDSAGSPSEQGTEPARAVQRGPCSSPRAAMKTLLDWQQAGQFDPARAATCIDRTGMEEPELEAPQIAVKLKKVLDARGLWVDLDAIPDDPDSRNNEGLNRYTLFPALLEGIALERSDGRWVFPESTVQRIPALYSASFPLDIKAFMDSMPRWMRAPLAGAKVWQLFGVFFLVLLALVLQKLVVALFSVYIRRLLGRLHAQWGANFAHRAGAPVGGMAMALVFWVGFPLLEFTVGINRVVLFATKFLSMASFVWLGYRMADVLSDIMAEKAAKTDTKLDDQLVPLIRKSMKVLMVVIGGLFILQNMQVDIGSLLAGLGLGGLAFALAAKDTVANFFGSVMIFVDRPFQIGDWVKIGDAEGTVEEVGFRSTRIRTFYNSLITYPNARLVDTAVDNLGARKYRRYSTILSLTYNTPAEKMEEFLERLRGLILGMEGMRKDYFLVEFKEYGAHSLDVMLYCFMETPDWATELRVRTNLNLAVLRMAREIGVQFAFPTRTIEVSAWPALPGLLPPDGEAGKESAE